MERVSDSRLWPKSFTAKLLEVLSSKGARLEEPLDDEQEKTGQDETELIGPEDILMTINSKINSGQTPV